LKTFAHGVKFVSCLTAISVIFIYIRNSRPEIENSVVLKHGISQNDP